MSGPLNSIFAAVQAGILGNLVGAGVGGADIVPTFGTTGAERAQEADWPRIVWVPISEDFQPPSGQGGDSDSRGRLPGSASPPLATRVVTVECDIWGADRDTTETMINAVFSAVHDAMYGSYGARGGQWLEPEETDKSGEVYRLTFTFAVPVLRVQPQTTTATITDEPITPQLQQLGA